MRLHLIYTGGTIGMIDSSHGLIPGADLDTWLADLTAPLSQDPDLHTVSLTLTHLTPLIDSSNATPDSWQHLITAIRTVLTSDTPPDGIVVLHGTDTMAYTAAALAYALTDLAIPVIVTGSQLPLGSVGSDAAAHVIGAIRAATHPRTTGVTLFFGHHLLPGTRASKTDSTAFQAFTAVGSAPLATAGAPWRWHHPAPAGEGWPTPPLPYSRHDVAVVDCVPGLSTARLTAMLTPAPEAVIVRGYGVGNIPSDEPGFVDALTTLINDDVAVLVTSQCHHPRVTLGQYETGDALARAGAVGTGDTPFEALYAKVQFLLSQGLCGAALAAWMQRSIAGEVTVP